MAANSGAGQYRFRFEHFTCTRAADGSTNDRPKAYTSAGYLWGAIDTPTASEQAEFGAVREHVDGTIRLRGWVAISAKDKLRHVQFDELYWVDGVRRDIDRYETVCDVHRITGGAA
jgi:hypothetical protein